MRRGWGRVRVRVRVRGMGRVGESPRTSVTVRTVVRDHDRVRQWTLKRMGVRRNLGLARCALTSGIGWTALAMVGGRATRSSRAANADPRWRLLRLALHETVFDLALGVALLLGGELLFGAFEN